ncbi:MAG: MerR family DNA-binding protein [Steroidobacteraceae bacterium]
MGKSTSCFLSTASLSKATGVGRETSRYYEEQGLIKPTGHTTAGYRQFDAALVGTIAFIKQTQRAGFSLSEIGHLLQLRAQEKDTCAALAPLFDSKLKEVDAALVAMQEKRAVLAELASACTQQDASRICRFVRNASGCC